MRLQTPKPVTTICELRIGGQAAQTVFPGSVHECGEPIIWETDGIPADVKADDLLARFKQVAVAALIARHWLPEGGRHDAALVLGGFLARAGFLEQRTMLVVEAVARAANDSEWKDRAQATKDAARKHDKGSHVYGLPKLIEFFDEPVARKVAEWLNYDARKDPPPEPTPDPKPLGEWDAGDDIELPKPRGWLLGNVFCRTFLSELIAESGTGKTALRYAQYLALVTGRPLTGEHVFQRCRVLVARPLHQGPRRQRKRQQFN